MVRGRAGHGSGRSHSSRWIASVLRHRVGRTAAVYAAVLFPALEGMQTIVQALGLPELVLDRLVVVALAGFPCALVLAWLADASTAGPILQPGHREAGTVLRASAVLTVGLAAAAGSAWLALRPADEYARIREIAVLPLANWMGDPSQDYFVEGMHDALIAQLAQVDGLTVIARTSVLRYVGTNLPVAQIARELGVDAVIEGSVFRAADSVRITVSLIHGTTQESLFTQSFNGSTRDALQLQRTVTRRVAEVLRVKLPGARRARLERTATVDPAVHELYLRGRAQWRTRTAEGLTSAIDLLESAVAADPDFAPAHAALADAYTVARGYGAIDMSWAEAYARAERAAERALELDPELPEAHASLAFLRFQSDHDLDAAERGLRRSLELNASNPQALAWLATLMRARGRAEEAVRLARQAQSLDPFSPVMNRYLGFTLARTGRCDEALRSAATAIDLAPGHPDGYMIRWSCHVLAGRFGDAAAAWSDVMRGWDLPAEDIEAHDAAFRNGGWRATLENEIEVLESRRIPVRPEYHIAQRLALLGRIDDALLTLERAHLAHDPLLVFELRLDPLIEPVRADARYRRLLERVGVTDHEPR